MGIGKVIAERVVDEGAKVVIHGLEQELAFELQNKLGEKNSVIHIEDLSIKGCTDRLVSLAIKTWNKIDAIVNNAALVISSNIKNTNDKLLEDVFKVNTMAPFLLIKSALPYLTKSKGVVLNIGSVNAWSGEPNLLAYSISKGALMTMTRNLGDSLHRDNGVRVNQINPGWVLTEKEIDFYISNNKVLDKAGAYGIQDWIGMIGVENINGSYTSVLGLPVPQVTNQILKIINENL